MSVSPVQATTYAPGSTGTSIVFALSSAPTPGNVLFAWCSYSQYNAARTISPPDGTWTLQANTQGGNDSLALFTHVVQAGDGTSYTFPISGSAEWQSGILRELSGVNTSNPISGTGAIAFTNSSAFLPPPLYPWAAGSLPIAAITNDNGSVSLTQPSGWTAGASATPAYHATCDCYGPVSADGVTPIQPSLAANSGSASGACLFALVAPAGSVSPGWQLVQSTSNYGTANDSLTLTLANAPTVGHFLLAGFSYQQDKGAKAIQAPDSNWTIQANHTGTVNGSTADTLAILTRVVQSGDGASFTFTLTDAGTAAAFSGVLFEIGGQQATPVNAAAVADVGLTTYNWTPPALTPSVLSTLPVLFCDQYYAANTPTSIASGWVSGPSVVPSTSYHGVQTFVGPVTTNTAAAIQPTVVYTYEDGGLAGLILIAIPASGAPVLTVVRRLMLLGCGS